MSPSAPPNRIILQWNCRSFAHNGSLLKSQVSSVRPLALLLQETRGLCKIPNYTTYMDPKIPRTYKDKTKSPSTPGQAAVLVHKSCHSVQHRWDEASNSNREVIIVRVQPPSGKPVLLVSVYYRPQCNSRTRDSYDWISHIFSLNFSGPVIIGGDFNARSTLWGYSHSDLRGKLLEQVLEYSPLQLCNEPFTPTRIGLHSSQQDTTPDLTLTTPGVVKKWRTLDCTWGSDHFPILMHLNSKKFRSKATYTAINWDLFRSQFHGSPEPELSDFVASVTEARTFATETVTSTVEVDNPDTHMHKLLRTAERLTKKYRERGKRHHDLMRLKCHYKVIISKNPPI